jgi:hypothetical protein
LVKGYPEVDVNDFSGVGVEKYVLGVSVSESYGRDDYVFKRERIGKGRGRGRGRGRRGTGRRGKQEREEEEEGRGRGRRGHHTQNIANHRVAGNGAGII